MCIDFSQYTVHVVKSAQVKKNLKKINLTNSIIQNFIVEKILKNEIKYLTGLQR